MCSLELIDYFILNQKKIYFSSLNNLDISDLSDWEKITIDFIKNWLSGQEEFTIYTSGSTGIPKPIILTREAMISSAKMTGQALGLKQGDKSLVCLPVEYIAGLMMQVRAIVLGLEMTIVEAASNPLKDFPENTHFDFTALIPLQLYEIFKAKDKINILDNMKAIIIGGGNISASLEEQIKQIKSPVYHTYGMTETITHIALKKINGNDKSDYFTVFDNVEINQDERGCLTIKSPVTNNQTIITNDLVKIISEKSFLWLGRIDNVINSGGIKVQAEKVESAFEKVLFKNNLSDSRFFITSEKDDKFGNIIISVIESEQLTEEIIEKLKNNLLDYLHKYEIPKKFYFVEKIELTKSGKIDKINTLKNLYQKI